MALQTATNPQTGERVVLINNQWVPITQSATNPEGTRAYLVNNQWITDTPEKELFPALRAVADVPVGIGKGVVQGVRMIADLFGAGSEASNKIKSVEDYLGGLMSAQAKNDQREIARIMKDAEDKGVLDQVKAGFQAFATAPVDMLSQGLGTAVPAIVAALGAKILGAGALATGAVTVATGAGMGAGVVKGTIYEETKKALIEAGADPVVAEEKAQQAQAYGGKNLDMILAGTVLGGAAALGPLEKGAASILARNISKEVAAKEAAEAAGKQAAKGALRRRTEAGLLEAVPEFVQAGQEKLAENIALQREGFDVPTMRGVVSSGVLEGLAGLGLGATIGGGKPPTPVEEEPAPPPAPEKPVIDESAPEIQKKLADYEKLKKGIAEYEAREGELTSREKGTLTGRRNRAEKLKTELEGILGRSLEEEADVAATEPAAIGESFTLSKFTPPEGAPGGPPTPENVGLGAPSGTAGTPPVGEGTPPVAVTTPAPTPPAISDVGQLALKEQRDAGWDTEWPFIPADLTNPDFRQLVLNDPDVTPEFKQRVFEAGYKLGVVPKSELVALAGYFGKAPPAPTPPTSVEPPAKPATPGGAKPGGAKKDLDELNGMLGGDEELSTAGTARRTKEQIALDEKIDGLASKYGLARNEGETSRELGKRIKDAIAFEQKVETTPLAEVSSGEIAAQTLKKEKPYFPPQEQRDLYEETAEAFNATVEDADERLPKYRELTDDERRVYFQNFIQRNDQTEHDRAARELSQYLAGKREESRVENYATTERVEETASRQKYDAERKDFGAKTSYRYSFPAWSDLSDESRKLFSSINKSNTALEKELAFRAVKAQLRKEAQEKSRAEGWTERESQLASQITQKIARERQAQPAGKGEALPTDVIDKALKGDIRGVLGYLQEKGQGLKLRTFANQRGKYAIPFFFGTGSIDLPKGVTKVNVRNSTARQVFRQLSGVLNDIPNFKVNVVIDNNMTDPTSLAEYDANTNTIYLGPNGLDEATILHELVHAATVQIIHQYYTDKSKLTPRAVAAVEQLQLIAGAAKKRLGSKYGNAFENLYEFVAYAMTDMDFQYALSQIQVPSLAKATAQKEELPSDLAVEREAREGKLPPDVIPTEMSLWDYFTSTLAWVYKLLTPRGRSEVYLAPTEKTAVTQATREELLRREEARKNRLAKQRAEARAKAEAEEELAEPETAAEAEAIEAVEAGEATQVARQLTGEKPDLEDEAEFKPFTGVEEQKKSEAKIEPAKDELVVQRGLTNLRKVINREPGYKGNFLLEVSAAFQDILAAPGGGIERLAGTEGIGSRLQAKAPAPAPTPKTKPVTKEADDTPELTDAEFQQKVQEQLTPKPKGARQFLSKTLSAAGYENVVKKFQNERRVLKQLFERAEKFGLVKRFGDDLNDVWGQITRSMGIALDLYAERIKPLEDTVNDAVEAYAKKLRIPTNEALANIHAILEARHEPERRHVKYLLGVPLDNDTKYTISQIDNTPRSPEGWREYILQQLSRSDLAKTEQARKAKAERFRTLLEKIVADKQMHAKIVKKTDAKGRTTETPVVPAMFDENSDLYNVIGERNSAEIARMKKVFDRPEYKKEIDAIVEAVKAVHEETIALNEEANYWSIPVQNVVNFYGYANYVPFKGKAGRTLLDERLDFESKRIGGELQEEQSPFGGRKSEADNPLVQSIADAKSAALRAGRKELTLAIKNAVDPKLKLLNGEVLPEKIKFEDRYLKGESREEFGGPNRIFHYNADGTIDVIEISDKAQLEAIRRGYRESHPAWDKLNALTSFVGQTHTRYNFAFAPMNFVRDALTNAFMLGAELGPAKAGRLISAIAAETAEGGLAWSMNFSRLYSKGDFAKINLLAGGTKPYDQLNSEQKYYRDLKEYVKLGGKVSYLQGIAAKGALDAMMNEVGRSGILRKWDQVNRFFDIYNEIFELSARVGAYRMLRKEFVAEGLSEEEAKRKATEYAKNLANFEQVGQVGKQAGGLFMFFRPAATGAVRAIDALRPAFKFNESDFRAAAQQEGRTPEQINTAVAGMKKQQKSARVMAAGLAGIGMVMYFMAAMLAGDDEEGRNRIETDDMARWTRYARFFVPGFENPIQIPWGFGFGAFAAAGAQIASLASPKSSLPDVLANVALIGMDSFLPLPISRINPLDNFQAWAIDSMMPSVARPFVQYVMNLDGLGREIYNNRQTKYGDAYTGGDNIPEAYKDAAKMLSKATDAAVDVTPNTLYFYASNYIDGFARIGVSAYNSYLVLAGEKDFNPKQDALFVSSFIGTKSNVDAREYSKLEDHVKGLKKRMDSLKNSDAAAYERFVKNNPNKADLVSLYNLKNGGPLKELREEANEIRASSKSPREKKAELDIVVRLQNEEKRAILEEAKEQLNYKP